MNSVLKDRVVDFVKNPYDLKINMDLGNSYEQSNQLASAISHYLRAAEFGLDSPHPRKRILICESLLSAARCFEKLGGRPHVTKGLIYQAIYSMPELPDAHVMMCKFYESNSNWFELAAACSTGMLVLKSVKDKFDEYNLVYTQRSYSDLHNELLYFRAMSDYYTGKTMKARIDFLQLLREKDLQKWIENACYNSLNSIGRPERFNQIGYNTLVPSKDLFKNSNFVTFSQCMQDILVSTLIGRNGKYLEIGSADPIGNSNTYLLERDYGWEGISVEIVKDLVYKFNTTRRNKAINANALDVNYKELLESNGIYDIVEYLQLDCEPPEVTFEVLTKMPFDSHRFAIITFEHDSYKAGNYIKDKSREFLKSKGYELLISDVAHNCEGSYEDWWVHPVVIEKYISREILNTIKNVDDNPKCVIDIFT